MKVETITNNIEPFIFQRKHSYFESNSQKDKSKPSATQVHCAARKLNASRKKEKDMTHAVDMFLGGDKFNHAKRRVASSPTASFIEEKRWNRDFVSWPQGSSGGTINVMFGRREGG